MPGFLPFARGSFMIDFVAVAMVLIIPVLTFSLYLVKSRKAYLAHRRLQIGLGLTLLIAITAFEVEIRINGWRHLAEASPYYDTYLFPFLFVHVAIATVTIVLWIATIYQAIKNIPNPPRPSSFSPDHRRLAKLAALGMYLTACTGWCFYYLAFIAE